MSQRIRDLNSRLSAAQRTINQANNILQQLNKNKDISIEDLDTNLHSSKTNNPSVRKSLRIMYDNYLLTVMSLTEFLLIYIQHCYPSILKQYIRDYTTVALKHLKYHKHQIIIAIFWFTLSLLLHAPLYISNAIASENTAIIIQSQQIAAYNEAIKGFKEGCKGKNISIKAIYDLKADTEEGKRVIKNIKDNEIKPDIILAVGVLAASLVKEQFSNIPIIFCMVINHERFNLQGANITGISSEASVEDQFAILKELLGTYKNVGVIYDPAKTGKIVSEATSVSKNFEFNLIKSEVASDTEVALALKDIINKIDALWIIPDSTVITKKSLDTISKTTIEHHLPIICTSEAIVKAGALVSVSPDYKYTGIQASQLAQMLLNNPTTASLGIRQPDRLKLTVNTQTAEIIGINLSSFQSNQDVILYPK